MVQVNELRIGNLVNWNPKLVHPAATLPIMPIEVMEIHQDKVGYSPPNFEHRVEPFEDDLLQQEVKYKPLAELEPIALTPALLEAYGFEKKDISDKATVAGYIKDTVVLYQHRNYFQLEGYEKEYKYLHEVQNLYFMLYGDELMINV